MTTLSFHEPHKKQEGARVQRIRTLLTAQFNPQHISLEDESGRHAHHRETKRGPQQGASETHLHLHLVSASFEGIGRVARSRLVHEALADEFANGLHALKLKLQTPEEYVQEEYAQENQEN